MVLQNKHTIAILMATFNGEKFIKEQIDTLLSQTCQDWELFVHDDCSSDKTIDIIKEYVGMLPDRVHLLTDELKKGRGARDSFIWLVEHVESDYYMFCDQDDIWMPLKIEKAITSIKLEEKKTPQIPICIYTDLILVDEKGNEQGTTFWKKSKLVDSWYDSLDAAIVLANRGAGCTMIFNSQAKKVIIPIDDRIYMHDMWLFLKVCMYGRCIGLEDSYIHYRIHATNTCGVLDKNDGNWLMNNIRRIDVVLKRNINTFKLVHDVTNCSRYRYLKSKIHNYILSVSKKQ